MPRLTRREFAKSTLSATAGGAALSALPRSAAATRATTVPAGRERLLLDRDWRFALGHANDPARDFGFGAGNDWDKVGEFLDPSSPRFDVSAWRTLDLPHDWAVELPFVNSEEIDLLLGRTLWLERTAEFTAYALAVGCVMFALPFVLLRGNRPLGRDWDLIQRWQVQAIGWGTIAWSVAARRFPVLERRWPAFLAGLAAFAASAAAQG